MKDILYMHDHAFVSQVLIELIRFVCHVVIHWAKCLVGPLAFSLNWSGFQRGPNAEAHKPRHLLKEWFTGTWQKSAEINSMWILEMNREDKKNQVGCDLEIDLENWIWSNYNLGELGLGSLLWRMAQASAMTLFPFSNHPNHSYSRVSRMF